MVTDLTSDWSSVKHQMMTSQSQSLQFIRTDCWTSCPMMHLGVRILSVSERQPHGALPDGVQDSEFSADRHERVRTEVCQETLPEGRRLVDET